MRMSISVAKSPGFFIFDGEAPSPSEKSCSASSTTDSPKYSSARASSISSPLVLFDGSKRLGKVHPALVQSLADDHRVDLLVGVLRHDLDVRQARDPA